MHNKTWLYSIQNVIPCEISNVHWNAQKMYRNDQKGN